MEQIIDNLVASTGSVFASITGITLPPIVIVITLIFAFVKGMKTLIKVACAALVIYVVWMMIQAGIIPVTLGKM